MRIPDRTLLAAIGAITVGLAGCSPYTLEGRVVEGAFASIEVVTVDDVRLGQPGVDGVRIVIERDPDRLSRHIVATATTAPDGRFAIALDEFGAGWMQELWGVRAQRAGYLTADTHLRLPDRTGRLLITLNPGSADTTSRETLLEQYERFK